MARNIEIKAQIKSIESLRPLVEALAPSPPEHIAQDDTFFPCPNGRLKLRTFSDTSGVLIFYRRSNLLGPKESYFQTTETSSPDALRLTLTKAYGQAGRVIKQRTVYKVGRSRIHLDRVQGLGDFLELEVVLSEGESLAAASHEAEALMLQLGITPQQLIDVAYIDLLTKNHL
jgi:predicted adenylyl cyclase CyaB